MAFRFAKKYSPKSKLVYNDYNIEQGAKALGAQRIVKLIQSYGVQIDAVGSQAHLTSEPTVSSGGSVAPDLKTLQATMKGFTDLNVDFAYTELDVRFNLPVTKEKLKVQADVYKRVTQSCVRNKRCVGITVWVCALVPLFLVAHANGASQGVSDKYSWIPGVFAGEGAALLFDEDFQKKPAYYAMLQVLLNTNK
jgi:endo-1,4-beta-xylanase